MSFIFLACTYKCTHKYPSTHTIREKEEKEKKEKKMCKWISASVQMDGAMWQEMYINILVQCEGGVDLIESFSFSAACSLTWKMEPLPWMGSDFSPSFSFRSTVIITPVISQAHWPWVKWWRCSHSQLPGWINQHWTLTDQTGLSASLLPCCLLWSTFAHKSSYVF